MQVTFSSIPLRTLEELFLTADQLAGITISSCLLEDNGGLISYQFLSTFLSQKTYHIYLYIQGVPKTSVFKKFQT